MILNVCDYVKPFRSIKVPYIIMPQSRQALVLRKRCWSVCSAAICQSFSLAHLRSSGRHLETNIWRISITITDTSPAVPGYIVGMDINWFKEKSEEKLNWMKSGTSEDTFLHYCFHITDVCEMTAHVNYKFSLIHVPTYYCKTIRVEAPVAQHGCLLNT